jgi:hypothetical protein
MRKFLNGLRAKITKRRMEAAFALIRVLFLVTFGTIAFFYLGMWLGGAGLLDVKTIVSVTVTEVGIAIIFYYLLGQSRRSREEEMVNLVDDAEKLSHLKVYTFRDFGAIFYYVENTTTKEYYKAPKNIQNMSDLGVITTIECKSEQEMKDILEKDNSHRNEKEPKITQLMAVKHKRKTKGSDSGAKTSP